MKFSFRPKDSRFYDLLEELIQRVQQGGILFKDLIENWTPTHPHIQTLKEIEHQCDQIVHEIMIKLNKTFVTPIDREDIHFLCKKTDDLIDSIQALSERMVLFRIQETTSELKEMALVLISAFDILVKVIEQIRDLKDPNAILKCCVQIHTLENQGDRIFETALSKLFTDQSNPLEVIKWKEIYDFLERAIDRTEDVADIVWGIVVKYG